MIRPSAGKHPQGVVDRLQWIGIADRALGGDADAGKPLDAGIDAIERVASRCIVVREPVTEA